MTGGNIFDEISAMDLPMLENEEPPISFYADLVEEGVVEVKYNERGGLVVTQGTQFEEKLLNKGPLWSLSKIAMVIVIVCGVLSAFTLHRISFGTIPCLCTSEHPCSMPNGFWARIIRRLFGMYGGVVRS